MSEELRKTIMDAMRSVSERADELKAGCATFDGEWPDAEDKAIYDAEVALVERLRVALTAISDAAQAPLTDELRAAIQAAADTAHRVLCAGGDYGDELSDAGLRRELKESRDMLRAILAAPVATAAAAPKQVGRDYLTLTGAQLLEALDFIAPDRATASQSVKGDERTAFDAMEHQVLLGYDELGDAVFGTDPVALAEWQARATAPQATVKGDETQDPTKELLTKYWTPGIGNTLTNVTQILDVVRQEWSAQGCWSEWDQSVRDDITAILSTINATDRAAVPQAGAPNDAAITACALMIKGICMTLPQDQWSRKIEERIRFMLATSQAEK